MRYNLIFCKSAKRAESYAKKHGLEAGVTWHATTRAIVNLPPIADTQLFVLKPLDATARFCLFLARQRRLTAGMFDICPGCGCCDYHVKMTFVSVEGTDDTLFMLKCLYCDFLVRRKTAKETLEVWNYFAKCRHDDNWPIVRIIREEKKLYE